MNSASAVFSPSDTMLRVGLQLPPRTQHEDRCVEIFRLQSVRPSPNLVMSHGTALHGLLCTGCLAVSPEPACSRRIFLDLFSRCAAMARFVPTLYLSTAHSSQLALALPLVPCSISFPVPCTIPSFPLPFPLHLTPRLRCPL